MSIEPSLDPGPDEGVGGTHDGDRVLAFDRLEQVMVAYDTGKELYPPSSSMAVSTHRLTIDTRSEYFERVGYRSSNTHIGDEITRFNIK